MSWDLYILTRARPEPEDVRELAVELGADVGSWEGGSLDVEGSLVYEPEPPEDPREWEGLDKLVGLLDWEIFISSPIGPREDTDASSNWLFASRTGSMVRSTTLRWMRS